MRLMHDEDLASRHVAQEERPHHAQEQRTREHDEGGVAERQFEANAHARGSIHRLFPPEGHLDAYRCGTRRRPPWR